MWLKLYFYQNMIKLKYKISHYYFVKQVLIISRESYSQIVFMFINVNKA
jgi:hypothetical protein